MRISKKDRMYLEKEWPMKRILQSPASSGSQSLVWIMVLLSELLDKYNEEKE